MKILSKRARLDVNLTEQVMITEDYIFPNNSTGKGSRVEFIEEARKATYSLPRSALDFIDVPKLIKAISIQGTLKNGPPETYSLHDDAMFQTVELTRCEHDPVYFMTKYCGLENRSALRDVVRGLEENRRIIVKHPRQIGITTTALAYALWKATFQSHQTILFATVNSMMASTASLQFEAMYTALPVWLRTPSDWFTRNARCFMNSSLVRFEAVNERLAKGQPQDLIILDSFASNRQELKEATWWLSLPAICREGTQLLIASTPCTTQDMFAEIWKQAMAGHPAMFPVELSFHQLPEAVQDRYREQRLAYGVETHWRECLGNFTHGELYEALVRTTRLHR